MGEARRSVADSILLARDRVRPGQGALQMRWVVARPRLLAGEGSRASEARPWSPEQPWPEGCCSPFRPPATPSVQGCRPGSQAVGQGRGVPPQTPTLLGRAVSKVGPPPACGSASGPG